MNEAALAEAREQSNSLASVHGALEAARFSSESVRAMNPRSIRFPDLLWEEASRICERHATSLPIFLRECCEGLCRVYGVPTDASSDQE